MISKTLENSNALFRKYYRPIEPIIQKPKHRTYTVTVLSFLAVSLFIWYAIRPTIRTILTLRREIRDNIQVNEEMENKITALVEAQAAYQNIESRLGLLKEAIPENPEMVDFMIQLRNLARSVDATILGANLSIVPLTMQKDQFPTAQPSPSSDQSSNKDYIPTLLSVSLEGTYESMKQFIVGIDSLRRIATIVDISLTPRVGKIESETDNTLSMTLKILVYSTNE